MSNLARRVPAGKFLSPAAAIQYIQRQKVQRVYKETPALELLGMEDELSHRLPWLQEHGKPVQKQDQITLDQVRDELAKRTSSELGPVRMEWIRRNKILGYFPDEGPLRREKYPKHVGFFAAGKTHRERLALGANRCLTPWTAIETGRGERLVRELIGETGFDVRSWDGNSRCTKQASSVFLKGIEPAFQIHLDNGEVFQCSGRHLVLLRASKDARRLSDWVSIDRLIRLSSGLHLSRTAQGWTASYGEGGRLYDEQLPSRTESFSSQLPRRRDVPSSGRSYSRVDAAASRFERSRAYQECDRLSIQDDPHLLADLCDKTEAPGAARLSLPKYLRDQIARRFVRGSVQTQAEILRLVAPLLSSVPRLSRLLLACDSPRLNDGRAIVAVVPLGFQPIVDFTVDDTHNYFAGGVVHHNSGKTLAAAYEIACHVTGRYPHWWPGHVFDEAPDCWIVNKSAKDVRDINEAELLGTPGDPLKRGTGMIPSHLIHSTTPKPGVPNGCEFINVKHISGDTTQIQSKSFDQGREAFQGRSKKIVWGDEEMPIEIATECLLRTLDCGGILLYTYTPLLGLTEMTVQFLEDAGFSIDSFGQRSEV